jgi:hypothetical protein
MGQRDILIAHGKAAMKAQLKDLIRKVENFELRDEET